MYEGLTMASKRKTTTRTALQRMTGIQLSMTEEWFIFEYTSDYNPRRAATAVGLHPDRGNELLNDDRIAEAIRHVYNAQMEAAELTPEVIKEEMYQLYIEAKQAGNLGVASKQLDQLARHSHIDAYAAQRVAVAADAEIHAALAAGRKRLAKMREEEESNEIEQNYDFS